MGNAVFEDEVVRALEQSTKSLNMGSLLWALAEHPCRDCFVPRALELNSQVRPKDRLEVKVEPICVKVGERTIQPPIGISYKIILNPGKGQEREVYCLKVDPSGIDERSNGNLY